MLRAQLLFVAVATLISAVLSAQTKTQDVVVELTNGFGVTKQVSPRTGVELGLLDLDRGACQLAVLAVRIAPGAVVCIPAWDLSEAVSAGTGRVRVTLKSGLTLEGAALGTLISGTKERDSLGTIQKLRVVSVRSGYENYVTGSVDREDMAQSSTGWILSASGQQLEIRRPSFWFRYYSSDGYVMGGSDRVVHISSLTLKKGTEELEAPLSDFAELTIRADGAKAEVSVTAPGGTMTTGSLSLHRNDSKGRHDASSWWFGGVLQGTSLTRVVTSEGVITLRRKSA